MGNRTDAQLFSDEAVPALGISPTKVNAYISLAHLLGEVFNMMGMWVF